MKTKEIKLADESNKYNFQEIVPGLLRLFAGKIEKGDISVNSFDDIDIDDGKIKGQLITLYTSAWKFRK